jgi:hypothetical protein
MSMHLKTDAEGQVLTGRRYAHDMEMEPGSAPPAAGPPAATVPAATAPASTGRIWGFLFTPRWLAWHLFMVISFWGMMWLGDWQFHRALGGNGLSWAYTFEWPLFAVFAVVFWARTIRDEFRIRRTGSYGPANGDAAEAALPERIGGAYTPAQQAEDEANDPELAAYNAYLARLNSEVEDHGKRHGLR